MDSKNRVLVILIVAVITFILITGCAPQGDNPAGEASKAVPRPISCSDQLSLSQSKLNEVRGELDKLKGDFNKVNNASQLKDSQISELNQKVSGLQQSWEDKSEKLELCRARCPLLFRIVIDIDENNSFYYRNPYGVGGVVGTENTSIYYNHSLYLPQLDYSVRAVRTSSNYYNYVYEHNMTDEQYSEITRNSEKIADLPLHDRSRGVFAQLFRYYGGLTLYLSDPTNPEHALGGIYFSKATPGQVEQFKLSHPEASFDNYITPADNPNLVVTACD